MRRAFTLIEIIIYLAIVGAIAVTLVGYSVSVSTARSKAEVVSEVQSNARFALEMIKKKVRVASDINFGASILGADPGVLTLTMQNSGENPTVFDLDVDDGRLRMTIGANPAEFLTSDDVEVIDLRFVDTTDGPRGHVQIFMTLRYKDAGSVEYRYEYSVEGLVGTRL